MTHEVVAEVKKFTNLASKSSATQNIMNAGLHNLANNTESKQHINKHMHRNGKKQQNINKTKQKIIYSQ